MSSSLTQDLNYSLENINQDVKPIQDFEGIS